MNTTTQDLSLLIIASCIFLLAIVNMYLVWRLIKGVRFEDATLDGIANNNQQILSQQLTVKHIVSDPAFLALFKGMIPTAPAVAQQTLAADDEMDPELMRGAKSISDAALNFGDLIDSFNNTKDADLSSWKAANQARINELLRAQATMRGEVDQLESMLNKANATILNLRAHNRQAGHTEGSGADAKQIETLKASIAARDTKIAAAEAVLKNEKTKFDEEKKKLQDKINEMQASFDRTIVEKNFIEEAFIEETQAHTKPAT